MVNDLSYYRQLIDQADRQIVKAIEQRLNAVIEVGKIKKANGLAIYDPTREAKVVEHVIGLLNDPNYAPYLKTIYASIMQAAKDLQADMNGSKIVD